jgi:hypothetical protein
VRTKTQVSVLELEKKQDSLSFATAGNTYNTYVLIAGQKDERSSPESVNLVGGFHRKKHGYFILKFPVFNI